MLVVAQPPEDEEGHQPHRDLVELRRIDRQHRGGIGAGGNADAEIARHDACRARRRALGEGDGEEAVPRPPVVVAHRPASRAAHGVRRRQRRCGHVGHLQDARPLVQHDRDHGQRAADEPAPVHEAAAVEDRVPVAEHHDIVQLRAEQSADECGEDHVGDRLRIVTPPHQLALRHHLRDDEAHQDRDSEAGELQRAEGVRERVVNDRMRQQCHAVTRPGRGREAKALRSSGARSPRSKWNSPARAIIAALSVASRGLGA